MRTSLSKSSCWRRGEFRKLLTADTATREGIFRKLFATQKYEMLQDRLGEECRKLERENEKLKSEVLRCAQTVRFAPQDARKEELDERRSSGAPMGAWLAELLEGACGWRQSGVRAAAQAG